ncbi:hypothetical protein [Streptomyces sp. Ac-502]|uniref:hypothetical protein n=1 Tax=Streptomyces sp. Ac-502 TaxID=3342801 RepID=UPI003862655A
MLTLTGVTYGVFALVLNLMLHLFMDSARPPPIPVMIGILVFNAPEGVVLGLVGLGILRLLARSEGGALQRTRHGLRRNGDSNKNS